MPAPTAAPTPGGRSERFPVADWLLVTSGVFVGVYLAGVALLVTVWVVAQSRVERRLDPGPAPSGLRSR